MTLFIEGANKEDIKLKEKFDNGKTIIIDDDDVEVKEIKKEKAERVER